MEQIPDAPWIRDAELNGADCRDPVLCPVCGSKCELIYADRNGEAVGCDECMSSWDAWEWMEQKGDSE